MKQSGKENYDRAFFGSRMILSHRWLGYLTILMQCVICFLLIYALIIGSGDLVISGCQKIGFYNYCLYNKTIEDCQCITQDVSFVGKTSQHGLVLAIILTYSSFVIAIMGIITMSFAHYLNERINWMFALVLNGLSLIVLSLGMITFVFLTWDLFDISQVTPGFLAVLAALFGMSSLCFIIRHNANFASGETGRSSSLEKL
ncbi:transmembrane protein 140 [Mantella aurantiaca]